MNTHKSKLNAIAAMALLAGLVGCGGGGSGGPSAPASTFDTSAFIGTWNRADGTTTDCFTYNTYGGTYWGLNRPGTVTPTTLTMTVAVYNDRKCTSKAGVVTSTHALTFSQGAIAGKSNVARVMTVLTGFSIGRDGDGTGISLTSAPVSGTTGKGLMYVSGTKLFVGDEYSAVDADGYFTALQSTALYER
jgi:hypothetical protein